MRHNPLDRRRHRNLRRLGKLQQFLRSLGRDNAATAIKHRALGLLDQADDFVKRQVICFLVRIVAAQMDLRVIATPAGALVCWMFLGKSITTGPGRPVRAM